MLVLMLMLMLRLWERGLLLQLLNALFDVIGSVRVNLALYLGINGLAELTELQLFLLHRIQQRLLPRGRVQRVVLLVIGLGITRHLFIHPREL